MNSTAPPNREKEIFEQALDMPPGAERLAFVQSACGEDATLCARVQALLQAQESARGFLPDEPEGGELAFSVSEKVGDRIGRYRLMEKIGEGGCGIVYVAEQEEPVRRRVALKIIKLGMDTREVVARFEAERQALALMDHPNIAQVYDGGATDTGRPYFVLELVRGVRITQFCDQHQLPTLDRLKLFIQVCHAIQHAHQKGIIHRDIKPSNILVSLHDDVPVPKVIDFGIAKAMGERLTDKTIYTCFEQFLGTPAYMSPEQAGRSDLDIDTRSDIYALGVLLYELLTGKTPFDTQELLKSGLDEMLRTIREKEPVRPSTRLTRERLATAQADSAKFIIRNPKPEIDKDLDWIVMKCLEKNRTRRYEAANGLAHDLECYLNQEPITARPPSTAYRVQKFVRRNKLMVAAVSAVAAALVLGIAVSAWQAVKATRAEGKAERALESEAAQRQRAEAALGRSRELLWQANFERAQVLRRSGTLGQRARALEAIRAAVAIRPGPELRMEAIAALALADLEDAGLWHPMPSNSMREAVDGRCVRFAVATSDGQIEVRSLLNNTLEGRLTNFSRAVDFMGFDQDGSRLAVESQDRSLVWEIATQRVLLDEPRRSCLAISSNGRQLLRLPNGPGVIVWDLDESREVARLETRERPNRAEFSPNGQRLALVCGRGVEVWDWKKERKEDEFPLPSGSIGLAWRSDGMALAVGCDDRALYIWRSSMNPLQRILCHGEGVKPFYHPGGDLLASVAWGGKLRLWDAETGTQWLESATEDPLGFSLDGRWLAVRRSQTLGRVRVHPPDVCRRLSTGPEANQGLGHPVFSPDNRFLANGMPGQFVVWDVQTGRIVWHQRSSGNPCVMFPDPNQLFTTTTGGVQVWTNLGSAAAWSLSAPVTVVQSSGQIGPFWMSRDQRQLVLTVNQSGAIYDLPPITSLAVATTADHGAAASLSASLPLVQPRLRLLGQPMFHEAEFSPDGRWIASGYWNNRSPYGSALWIWSATDGRPIHQIALDRCQPHFSPDGRWLVAVASREYRLYAVEGSPEAWREIWRTSRDSPGFAMSAAAFKHDGTCIAVLADLQTIRLVATSTGRELVRLTSPAYLIVGLAWSPDDRWLAVASQNGMFLWDLALLRARLGALQLDWE